MVVFSVAKVTALRAFAAELSLGTRKSANLCDKTAPTVNQEYAGSADKSRRTISMIVSLKDRAAAMKKQSKGATGAGKTLRKQIENIRKQRIRSGKVVSLDDFRNLRDGADEKCVLVVDDDEVMRGALKRILEAEGMNVVLAEDGLDLSRKIETNRVDLILLDVSMPSVDGYELCRLLKAHPSLATVPVVFVSAHKTAEDIQRGFDAGGSDYVAKPFDVDQLTQLVHKYLQPATRDAS